MIYQTEYFKLEHAGGCFIPGYVIVTSKFAAKSVCDLAPEAQAELGLVLAQVSALVEDVVQPERIYTISLGELLPLVHFHIFPRTAGMLADYKAQNNIGTEPISGALLFEWARSHYQTKTPEYEAITAKITELMAAVAD